VKQAQANCCDAEKGLKKFRAGIRKRSELVFSYIPSSLLGFRETVFGLEDSLNDGVYSFEITLSKENELCYILLKIPKCWVPQPDFSLSSRKGRK
jgi:hypothetical protein